jgi:hypothetical protein
MGQSDGTTHLPLLKKSVKHEVQIVALMQLSHGILQKKHSLITLYIFYGQFWTHVLLILMYR